jgi:hypothetical protein
MGGARKPGRGEEKGRVGEGRWEGKYNQSIIYACMEMLHETISM